jgi:hypothetical protein
VGNAATLLKSMTVSGDELPCSAGSGCCLFATTENGSIGYGVPGEKMTVNHGRTSCYGHWLDTHLMAE